MMKQYMKNKSLFLQKEELLSRIAELFSKKILRPSGVLVFLLITCLGLFSCSKFLEENPKDKLPEDDVYNTISEVYLNAVASLYTYVGGYSDSHFALHLSLLRKRIELAGCVRTNPSGNNNT